MSDAEFELKDLTSFGHGVAAYGAYTNKGPVRAFNEDAYLADSKRALFGVADGFGGAGAGDLAAREALSHVQFFVEHGLGDSEVTLPFVYRSYLSASANLIFNAFLYANEKIWTQNKEKSINSRGATSLAFAFFEGRNMTLANVGGCAAYLLRNGRVQALNRPRTLNSLRGAFQGSWNTKGAIPLAAIGQAKDMEPEITELKTMAGDHILLATDGVYGALTESDILECFQVFASEKARDLGLERLQHKMIELSGHRGNTDNLSMISIICK